MGQKGRKGRDRRFWIGGGRGFVRREVQWLGVVEGAFFGDAGMDWIEVLEWNWGLDREGRK